MWSTWPSAVGVSAHDNHPDTLFGVHLSGGFNQEVQAFQRFDSADIQQYLFAVQAKPFSDGLLVQGAEYREVDAAGHQ